MVDVARLKKWLVKRADIRHRSMWKRTPFPERQHSAYEQGYLDGLNQVLGFIEYMETPPPEVDRDS